LQGAQKAKKTTRRKANNNVLLQAYQDTYFVK